MRGRIYPVTRIQRIDTVGGVAPRSGCSEATAATSARIDYTADYHFFVAKCARDIHPSFRRDRQRWADDRALTDPQEPFALRQSPIYLREAEPPFGDRSLAQGEGA